MSEKLYKIICTLPNAATEINGIEFEEMDAVLVALDVSANDAKCFKNIPGYEVTLLDDEDDNEDSHEGQDENNNSVHNDVLSALKKMNVTDIKDFLKVQPDAWNHVLTLEEKRAEKRQGVMEAVKSAKVFLNENTASKSELKVDSKPETKRDSNV